MRFTLFVDSRTWLGWSDASGQVEVFGDHVLIARMRRAESMGRTIGGWLADLSSPHAAYKTMLAVLRERTDHAGPIEFTGFDDDGLEITFIPEPDAENPVTR